MRTRSGLLVVCVIAAFLMSSISAFSQVTTAQAQLNGSVRDQSGGAIVKASITLRYVDTNRVSTAVSNDVGYYILPNLPPGRYELTAEYTGFGKYTQTGIVLSVGQVATIDITLKVAGAGEKIVVTTETPIIEPTRTEVSQVIDTTQIVALPINGRLFTDFALLSPGVATGRTSLQSTFTDPTVTRISFGGQRDLNNSVTVDGADNINTSRRDARWRRHWRAEQRPQRPPSRPGAGRHLDLAIQADFREFHARAMGPPQLRLPRRHRGTQPGRPEPSPLRSQLLCFRSFHGTPAA